MRKFTIILCLMLLALPLSRKVHAQDTPNAESPKTPEAVKPPAPPVHYYRFDFVIEELSSDGKPINSRRYSTSVNTEDRGTTSIHDSDLHGPGRKGGTIGPIGQISI
jgi:hypothetical protein